MAAEQPQQPQSEDTEEFLLDEMKKETMSFISLLLKSVYVGDPCEGNCSNDTIYWADESGPKGMRASKRQVHRASLSSFKEQLPNYIRNMVMYTNRLNAVYERERNNAEGANKAPSTSKPPPEVPLGEVSIAASTQPSVYEAVAARLQGGKPAYKKKQRGGYNWRSPGKKTKTRKTKTTTRTKTRTKTRSLKK